jgi:hypothetical protein
MSITKYLLFIEPVIDLSQRNRFSDSADDLSVTGEFGTSGRLMRANGGDRQLMRETDV